MNETLHEVAINDLNARRLRIDALERQYADTRDDLRNEVRKYNRAVEASPEAAKSGGHARIGKTKAEAETETNGATPSAAAAS